MNHTVASVFSPLEVAIILSDLSSAWLGKNASQKVKENIKPDRELAQSYAGVLSHFGPGPGAGSPGSTNPAFALQYSRCLCIGEGCHLCSLRQHISGNKLVF